MLDSQWWWHQEPQWWWHQKMQGMSCGTTKTSTSETLTQSNLQSLNHRSLAHFVAGMRWSVLFLSCYRMLSLPFKCEVRVSKVVSSLEKGSIQWSCHIAYLSWLPFGENDERCSIHVEIRIHAGCTFFASRQGQPHMSVVPHTVGSEGSKYCLDNLLLWMNIFESKRFRRTK